MTTTADRSPQRALRTSAAARYLGLSPSLLRKMRARGPDDPLGTGPDFVRLSPLLIIYEISVLDDWLDHRRAAMKAVAPASATAGAR
jgi:hypothetical protein